MAKSVVAPAVAPELWSRQGFQMWGALDPVGLAAEPVGDRRNILARGKETMGENYGQQKPQAAQRAATLDLSLPLGEALHGSAGEGEFLNKVKSHFIKNEV